MNPGNNTTGPSIRNSYGYQDPSVFRAGNTQKTYQQYTPSYQDKKPSIYQQTVPIYPAPKHMPYMQYKPSSSSRIPQYSMNPQKRQQQFRTTINVSQSDYQFYQPTRYNNQANHHVEERSNQLRGSCPNIFKKFDQTSSLRSTTQFINLSKFAFQHNNKNQQPEVRMMKKNQTSFVVEQNGKTSQLSHVPHISSQVNTQVFNANKSLSSCHLQSLRYNLNKSNISKQVKQANQIPQVSSFNTPQKSKVPSFEYIKKSPQISVKTSSTSNSGLIQSQQKKFKSLHEIWEIKEKEKTQRKINESITNNLVHKSKQLINGFQIGKVLGKGKFGEVFLARHQLAGFVVAIKKIVKSKVKQYKMIQQFSKQIKLHNSLDHPNIVKFFGCFQQQQNIFLVMQYMNGGTLFDYLNQVFHLSIKQTIQFLRDIIQSLIYLHEKSIAHRDIKPQNIVISSEGVAKLCDFGWSAVVETSRKTYCGTFDYAPPEILERKSYDMSVDVWCIGVLTYQLLTGRVPFEGQQRNDIMDKIVNVDKNKIQYPIDIPQQAKDFIEWLVQKEPSLRPKPTQLLKHPFFGLCPSKSKSKKVQ